MRVKETWWADWGKEGKIRFVGASSWNRYRSIHLIWGYNFIHLLNIFCSKENPLEMKLIIVNGLSLGCNEVEYDQLMLGKRSKGCHRWCPNFYSFFKAFWVFLMQSLVHCWQSVSTSFSFLSKKQTRQINLGYPSFTIAVEQQSQGKCSLLRVCMRILLAGIIWLIHSSRKSMLVLGDWSALVVFLWQSRHW